MTAWHEIALPTGKPNSGVLGLHCNFRLPSPTADTPASARQRDSVTQFFETNFGELSEDQAHTLLCCREYARLAASSIFKLYPEPFRHLMARAFASFILSDNLITEFAIKWNENNFKRGTGSPRVTGTPYYEDLRSFSSYLIGMFEQDGWNDHDLRCIKSTR